MVRPAQSIPLIFVEEEGTHCSFRGLREVIETYGSSVRSIRIAAPTTGTPTWREAAWTSAVDARTSRLAASGYHPDAAYLPEARGRSERAFRTLQDRLPKELALAGISNMRFAIPAAETGTAFIPWIGSPLAEILCVQEERVVAIDNPVRVSGPELADPAGSPPALVI